MSRRPRNTTNPADHPTPQVDRDDWRLFLAIPLPDAVKSRIRDIAADSSVAKLPLRLVDPSLAHMTLHFLGPTPAERAELLGLALPAALNKQRAFTLRTGNLGFFPNDRKPRVFWLGLEGNVERVGAIHLALGRTLESIGFEIDRKPVRPHVTIGRVRDGAHPRLAEDIRSMLTSPGIRAVSSRPSIEFEVAEIELIRSHLEKTGPRYEVLRRFPLAR